MPVAAAAPTAPPPVAAPAESGLHAAVHEDLIEQAHPRTRTAPDVLVHGENIDQRSGPVQMTPSQALALARDGRDGIKRPPPAS